MLLRLGMLAVLCCLLGFAPRADEGTRAEPPTIEVPEISDMRIARVVRVVDGDTVLLELDDEEIVFELLGANAPEFIDRDPTPRRLSREAWFVMRGLLDGESVYVYQDSAIRKNAAGRMTGFLFRAPDLLFVNMEMIRQGYAEYRWTRSSMYLRELLWWQKHASDAKKGVWSEDPVQLLKDPPEPAEEIVPVEQIPEPSMISPAPDADRSVQYVYLTKSGSKYHTSSCRYHSADSRRVEISKARDGYQPCKVCKPDDPQPASDDDG